MGWHSRDQGDSEVWLSGLHGCSNDENKWVFAGSRGRVKGDIIDIKLVG